MRYVLAVFSFVLLVGLAPCHADEVAGSLPANASQARLVPDLGYLPVAQCYGEYLMSVGVKVPHESHPRLGQGQLDMDVQTPHMQSLEAESEQPSVAESLAADQRLPAGLYTRHESALDVHLGGGWRLVGNDGIANGREESFVGLGYSPQPDVTIAAGIKIRGEEAPEEEDHHGPRPLPIDLTVMVRW